MRVKGNPPVPLIKGKKQLKTTITKNKILVKIVPFTN